MKKWLMAIVFGSVLVLGACGGGGDNNNAANEGGNNDNAGDTASAAEEIYESNCSACHGDDLTGNNGPDLTNVGADHSADEIEEIIHEGIGGMPAQTQVSDEDAETLANWLADKK